MSGNDGRYGSNDHGYDHNDHGYDPDDHGYDCNDHGFGLGAGLGAGLGVGNLQKNDIDNQCVITIFNQALETLLLGFLICSRYPAILSYILGVGLSSPPS